MPRMTAKYTSALGTALDLGLVASDRERAPVQDELYQRLNTQGYFWDSEAQQWVKGEAPEPARQTVAIRVWADTDLVAAAADDVVAAMAARGYTLDERSDPYICRPPRQLESRVYLTFLPKEAR